MFYKASLSLLILMLFVVVAGNSQCVNWEGLPNQADAENAHSIYRAAMKTNDSSIAFDNWKRAYEIAPAADGNRDFHFTDGIKFYKTFYKNETDATKKAEHASRVLELYDEAIACYEAGGIKLKCDGKPDCYTNKSSFLHGRKGYDMYYELNQDYTTTMVELEKAIEIAGNNVEYIVLNPLANIVVYQYLKDQLDADKARQIHKLLNDIADYNIENNKTYGPYFKQAIDGVNAEYGKIETKIFDCDFFIAKLKPQYDENPDDPELAKNLYNELRKRGCEDSVPLLSEMKAKYEVWAEKINAEKQAEFEANNPSVVAKKLYDEGDFAGSIAKYNEAIEKEEDIDKKASYLFSKASIQFRKLRTYGAARATAREAASIKKGWGRPYMLIGDMYGSTARSCGDSWSQRLAILAAMEKYQYARAIDEEVADDANDRLSKYRSAMPAQEEGFMRKIKAGQKVPVSGCWIGETVTVRYK